MQIIRFLDSTNRKRYGLARPNGTAELLKGSPFGRLATAQKRTKVVKLLAPVEPAAIIGIGLNYRDHAREIGAGIPRKPVVFMKNPSCVTNPDDPIVIPASCVDPLQVDYEVELAVVIRSLTRRVTVETALDHVLGYTIANDVTARTWQKNAGGKQWTVGKSFDTFCPLGPAIVTPDEIKDPQNLQLKCCLNGRLKQYDNTSDMIFSVAELITYLSEIMTLLPGTVILTGTPSGVGCVRKPPVFLKAGDRLDLTIHAIGALSNPVVNEEV